MTKRTADVDEIERLHVQGLRAYINKLEMDNAASDTQTDNEFDIDGQPQSSEVRRRAQEGIAGD